MVDETIQKMKTIDHDRHSLSGKQQSRRCEGKHDEVNRTGVCGRRCEGAFCGSRGKVVRWMATAWPVVELPHASPFYDSSHHFEATNKR